MDIFACTAFEGTMKKIITDIEKRWEMDIDHHKKSLDVQKILSKATDLSFGGDGDDGEQILYALDIYFETEENK